VFPSMPSLSMAPDSIVDEPVFNHDDLELMQEQESLQLRFRESGHGHLVDGKAAAPGPDSHSTVSGRSPARSEAGVLLWEKPALPSGLIPGSDFGLEWQTGASAIGNVGVPLWELGPCEGYSWDDLAACLAPDIFSDSLTREQRALQVAAEVAGDYGWDRAGVALLAEVFERYSWSASQIAVRRAIEHGMTQKEFAIAARVRQMWSERCEFWVASSYGSLVQRHALLTWPGALGLIRSFEGYPDVDEVESMLDIWLEQWLHSRDLQLRFHSFFAWALQRCEARGEMRGFDAWAGSDGCLGDDDDLDDVALLRELDSYGIGLGPEWQPVSRGAPRKENIRLPADAGILQWPMSAVEGDDEC